MLIRRYTFTILTLVIFGLTLWSEGMLFGGANVSPETFPIGEPLVKQGVTQDGAFALTAIPDAPSIPPRSKMGNPLRNLRAFIASSRGGLPALYVETVKPHAYYVIAGSITPKLEYGTILWTNPTTLRFYGSGQDGELRQVELDVHTLSVDIIPIEESVAIKAPPDSGFDSEF